MAQMSKEEALKKIEELKEYVNCVETKFKVGDKVTLIDDYKNAFDPHNNNKFAEQLKFGEIYTVSRISDCGWVELIDPNDSYNKYQFRKVSYHFAADYNASGDFEVYVVDEHGNRVNAGCVLSIDKRGVNVCSFVNDIVIKCTDTKFVDGKIAINK